MKLFIVAFSCLFISFAVKAEEECPDAENDWTFRVGGEQGRGCAWVGRNVENRCLTETGAKEACALICCGVNDPPPPPTPTPPTPTPVPPPLPVFQSAAPLNNQFDTCTDFCKAALTTCEGVVDWVTNTYANPTKRHFDGGAGTDATGKPSEQFDACHDTCMGWVYWRQDDKYSRTKRWHLGYMIGDSLNCRMNHVAFSAGSTGDNFVNPIFSSERESAARHCNHITPDGGWICTDHRNADNKTPSQLYKEAMFTKHRMGDCWLAADDTIADCHRKGLTDATVDQNLLWLPDDIEYIFLHVNLLTMVPDLSRFTSLKGIYLESNAIDTLHSDDFEMNTKLEIIYINNNFIVDFPADLLSTLTELKAFYLSWNYVTSLPATAFQNSLDLEIISLPGNQLPGFEAGTFDNLSSLKVLAIGEQGKGPYTAQVMDESGIPDGLFDDLVSLEFLSSFINDIGTLKSDWFGEWSENIEDLSFLLYQLGPKPPFVVEDGVFDKLPNLIKLSLYQNGNVVSPSDVQNNSKLKTVLYGNPDILAPLPHPEIVKADLIAV